MEILAICLAAYVILLAVGLRSIRKKGRKREMVWYAGLIGWCVYMSAARMLDWPIGSLMQLDHLIFAPVGHWLEQVLSGLPH